jgi:hypothetical protein
MQVERPAQRVIVRTPPASTATGAIFGTLLAATASTVGLSRDTGRCHVDLIQTIGNGATWGTLVGFASAFWLLFTALTKVASASQDRSFRRVLGFASMTLWLIAGNSAIYVPGFLATSPIGWPR